MAGVGIRVGERGKRRDVRFFEGARSRIQEGNGVEDMAPFISFLGRRSWAERCPLRVAGLGNTRGRGGEKIWPLFWDMGGGQLLKG